MPRQIEVVQQIIRSGLDEALAAGDDANHHEFRNSGKEFLDVLNGSGSPINVILITPNLVDGQAITDRTVVVPATSRTKIGPFPPSVYNNASGFVQFSISLETSITLGVFSY